MINVFKIFFNSVPKSGTNLMQKCLELMGVRKVGTLISGEVSPFTRNAPRSERYKTRGIWKLRKQYAKLADRSNGYLTGIVRPVEKSRYLVEYLVSNVKDGEFLQAHLGYSDELLLKLKSFNFKTIVMIRDPRAILLSRLHYITKTTHNKLHPLFQTMGFEDKVNLLLNGFTDEEFSVQSMFSICNSVTSWINDETVLTLKKVLLSTMKFLIVKFKNCIHQKLVLTI